MPESNDEKTEPRPYITPNVTLQTLERTPQRVLTFLRGVGLVPRIHAILSSRGYREENHREGWNLLHIASGHSLRDPGPSTVSSNEEIQNALAEIDALDETVINIIGATLRRHFPTIAEEVLEGVKPSRGAESVIGMNVVLQRLDEVEQRGGKDEEAALALLAERGYGKAERERIEGLLRIAESVPDMVPVDPAAEAAAHERYVQDLARLRAWYEEWLTIARSTIKRRADLIRLGLASRRVNVQGEEGEDLGEDAEL